MRDSCPVCGAGGLFEILRRNSVPVFQNLPKATVEAAKSIGRGDLSMVICKACSFVFNRAFDASKVIYDEDYQNEQACSQQFSDYLDERINYLVNERGVKNKRIVEIGCGKGEFIKRMIENHAYGNIGYGYDKSYQGECELYDGRLRMIADYYHSDTAEAVPDVIICRHVIEHVPDPLSFLKDIRQSLPKEGDVRVYFETPCVEWILDNHVFWDFFYEHCSLFSANTISRVFKRAGFDVIGVQYIFNGQYLWVEAKLSTSEVERWSDGSMQHKAEEYARHERALISHWKERIAVAVKRGGVAVWGGGAKGVTFLNLLDPDRKIIDCVVDLNPNKQGRYIPGSGHPIISPCEIGDWAIRTAILMNPNYKQENHIMIQSLGFDVILIE